MYIYIERETYAVKARRKLHKNAASSIEHVLEAAPEKAAAVQSSTTHHENYPSQTKQTYGILLEK